LHMATVTISKRKYDELAEKAMRYEYVQQLLKGDIFSAPPTRSRKSVLKAFRETGKYNQKFLASLEKGLKRSPYFIA